MTNRDIIQQYVNTGICKPEYQFNKLNSGLRKSYLRARKIALDNNNDSIQYYKYIVLNDGNLINIYNKIKNFYK